MVFVFAALNISSGGSRLCSSGSRSCFENGFVVIHVVLQPVLTENSLAKSFSPQLNEEYTTG